MAIVATWFGGATEPGRAGQANDTRRMLRALLGALDRLVPPSDAHRNDALPAQWFKYPPI
jgi:hypothetical protein